MNKKGYLTTFAVVVLLTTIVVQGASAREQNITNSVSKPSSVTPTDQPQSNNYKGDNITPLTIGNRWSGTASGDKQPMSAFVVPKNYGHAKLWYQNNGTSDTMISVKHVESGLVYINSVTVKPGKSLTWRSTDLFPQGMRSGEYIVSYRSSSANANISYAGFASNNAVETKG